MKLIVTLFLVSSTLSLFLTSVYALPSKIGGGGDGSKAGSFGLQNSPSGFERPDNNNGVPDNNLEGAFSGIERSASPPSNSGPTGGLANSHPFTSGDTPAGLSSLQQQQQQHQPLANPNHVQGCPTVVNPNGADTKVVQPSNCSPPTPDNTPQTNSRVVHTNNNDNCATVVHPNGADTKVLSSNGCPTNTNTHVTVNSGGTTTSSSSSSLTVNNVQGSNSGTTTGGSGSSSTKANTIPIANAGPNQKVHLSDRVVLDGSKSSDPSGGSLKFSWLQIAGGPTVSLSNHDKNKTTFVAPSVTASIILTFQLIVNNGNYYSAPSYVTITVQP
jgi:K319-like protein